MRRALAPLAALAALIAPGCAAIPAAVAVGAMATVPGDQEQTEARRDERTAALETRSEPESGPAAAPPPDALTLEALPPQDLAPGQCALFLFTRGPDSAFVFFAPGEGETARIRLSGADRALRRADETERADGQFSWTYDGDDGLAARLRARPGEDLPQGRRIPEASLRLTRPGGGALVTPLAGLIGCEAA